MKSDAPALKQDVKGMEFAVNAFIIIKKQKASRLA